MTNLLAILVTSLVTNVTTVDNATPSSYSLHTNAYIYYFGYEPKPATEKTETYDVNEVTELVVKFEGAETRHKLKSENIRTWQIVYRSKEWVPVATNELIRVSSGTIIATNMIITNISRNGFLIR